MDTPVLAEQQKLTFINSDQRRDAVSRIYKDQLALGMAGVRESKEFVQSDRHNAYHKIIKSLFF